MAVMRETAPPELRGRPRSRHYLPTIFVVVASIAACEGDFSPKNVDQKLVPGVEVEAKLVSAESLETSAVSHLKPPPNPTDSGDGRYVVLNLRNTTNFGVWGSVDVALGDDRTYGFRVPHLEPHQPVPVVFVAYVGSGWTATPGARAYKWTDLHGK